MGCTPGTGLSKDKGGPQACRLYQKKAETTKRGESGVPKVRHSRSERRLLRLHAHFRESSARQFIEWLNQCLGG